VDEPIAQNDSASLLAALAAGSDQAFALIYDRFGERLFRTALGIVGRRQDAEDVVQDVFTAMVRSRRRLVDVNDLPAYLFASLRRQAARRAARRTREPGSSTGMVSQAATPEPAPEDPRNESLRRSLAALSIEQREVIAMRIEGELTFAEIARVLGININTAASRHRYALERLRQRLKE
jgi:RNA polymerase sigma-70 factor, ECF subfamily